MGGKLSKNREKFIKALVQGLPAQEAYKLAYRTENLKEDTIREKAQALAQQAEIKQRLQQLQGARATRETQGGVATPDTVLAQLSQIGMGAPEDENDESARPAAVRERLKALELLGKHYKLFQSPEDTKKQGEVQIVDDIKAREDI